MAANKFDCGIYIIENTVNGRRYVGSACAIKSRWKQHKRQLSENRHHSRFLQHAWNKYGAECFVFKVAIYCDKASLIFYEQTLIDFYRPDYNSAPKAGSQLGYRHTDDARKKMSQSRQKDFSPMTGKRHSAGTKRRISESRKGKGGGPMSEETRAKISAAHKGRSCPVERRRRISEKLTGHKQSPEQIEKRVQKLRGRKMPDGFGSAISARMKGRKLPQQTVDKIAKNRAKLTDDQVRNVKEQIASGVLQRVIAYNFCVDQSVISEINTGKSYRWVF